MKKLLSIVLLLLSVLLFFSCLDDIEDSSVVFDNWNDPQSENYVAHGYNPVLGEWVTPEDPRELTAAITGKKKLEFTRDFEFTEYSYNDSLGWVKRPTFPQKYIINDKAIKLVNLLPGQYPVIRYGIARDSILLLNPLSDGSSFLDYYRVKEKTQED